MIIRSLEELQQHTRELVDRINSTRNSGARFLAYPLPGEPDVWLVAERVRKELICELGVIEQNGKTRYRCGGIGSNYEYRVWITNDGYSRCRFQVEGGGVEYGCNHNIRCDCTSWMMCCGCTIGRQVTGSSDEEVPFPSLLPLEGQRLISFDIPQEVVALPGPELHHFLSHLTISWPADVQVPKLEIVKKT